MAAKKKYYKVVEITTDGKMEACANSFKYTPQKWHNKSETDRGNPFFVFTTLEEANNYMRDYRQLWECEVVNPHTNDIVLGNITDYKNNAVFCDSVKLIQRINGDGKSYEFIPLKDGMVFRVKRTKTLLMYSKGRNKLVYAGGKYHGEVYDEDVSCNDVTMLCTDHYLVYLPGTKVKTTVQIIHPKKAK